MRCWYTIIIIYAISYLPRRFSPFHCTACSQLRILLGWTRLLICVDQSCALGHHLLLPVVPLHHATNTWLMSGYIIICEACQQYFILWKYLGIV